MTSRSRSSTSRRHGFSLVELMAAVTMSVVILGIATTLLHRMFAHQQVAKAESLFQLRTSRLAHHFRGDARAATTCAATDETELKLTHDNGTVVTYRVDPELPMIVHREQTLPDAEEKHIDQFDFPASCSVAFARIAPGGEAKGALAQLRIKLPDATLESNATRSEAAITVDEELAELIIETAVGSRSRRLQKASPSDE